MLPWLLLAFAGGFLASYLVLCRGRLLYDNDSYYHLAAAREIATHGLPHDLPWARFSAMAQGFGDKEVLFHLLLAPFAALGGSPESGLPRPVGQVGDEPVGQVRPVGSAGASGAVGSVGQVTPVGPIGPARAAGVAGAAGPDGLLGGRLALAFFHGLLAAAMAFAGLRAVGRWGVALPFVLFYASPELAWRLVRLRPELLSLLLLLLALWAVAKERYRLLGGLAALYALSYTAFHAFLGLCGLLFLFFGLARRRWDWRLPLYATLGVGLGLVIHPNFPKNLEIWVLQSVEFFRRRGELDAGTEFLADPTDAVLGMNLAWLLAAGVLAWAASRWSRAAPRRGTGAGVETRAGAALAKRAADTFGVAAAVFGLLYLLMSRFSTYFFPFATLWLVFEWGRQREALHPAGRRRLVLPAVLGCALLAGLPEACRELALYQRRTSPGPGEVRLVERAAFARALPPGSRVAAPWRSTALYVFYAPRSLFLNLLDPVFMAVPHPEAYALQRDVFAGDEPDVPLATLVGLDSDLIAFPEGEHDRLLRRLVGDPRATPLHRGFNAVFRLNRGANRDFVLDWSEVPPAPSLTAPSYPRLPASGGGEASSGDDRADQGGGGGDVEGYVDAGRLRPGAGCLRLAHTEEVPSPAWISFELAPSGPSTLELDGRQLVATAASLGAELGRGLLVPVELTAGKHRLTVLTCPEDGPAPHTGFYLLRRESHAQPASR